MHGENVRLGCTTLDSDVGVFLGVLSDFSEQLFTEQRGRLLLSVKRIFLEVQWTKLTSKQNLRKFKTLKILR